MKKLSKSCMAMVWMLLASGSAHSVEVKPQGFSEARKLEESDGDDLFRLGVGYSFFGTFSKQGQSGSLSALLDLNSTHAFQILFGVSSVRRSFDFGAGVAYRGTVVGDRNLGFHVGALANLGFVQGERLVIQAGPILGIHVALFHLPQLQLSLDGGPLLVKEDEADFHLGFIGPAGGLSIHYFF